MENRALTQVEAAPPPALLEHLAAIREVLPRLPVHHKARMLAELAGVVEMLRCEVTAGRLQETATPPRASGPDEGELLTPEQVAALAKITRRNVYCLIRSRRIPARRIGKYWRIRRSDFEAWQKADSREF